MNNISHTRYTTKAIRRLEAAVLQAITKKTVNSYVSPQFLMSMYVLLIHGCKLSTDATYMKFASTLV